MICTLGNFSTKLLRGDTDRDLAAPRPRGGARRSGRARCGCTRSITRRRRCTRRRRSRRCAPTSSGSRSCWPRRRPSSRQRRSRPEIDDAPIESDWSRRVGVRPARAGAGSSGCSERRYAARRQLGLSLGWRADPPLWRRASAAAPARGEHRADHLDAEHDGGESGRVASGLQQQHRLGDGHRGRSRSGTSALAARACTGPPGRCRPAP